MTMRDPDYYTGDTCKTCNGDGVGEAQLDSYGEIHINPCIHCEGHGKQIDPIKYNEFMSEWFDRTFKC